MYIENTHEVVELQKINGHYLEQANLQSIVGKNWKGYIDG